MFKFTKLSINFSAKENSKNQAHCQKGAISGLRNLQRLLDNKIKPCFFQLWNALETKTTRNNLNTWFDTVTRESGHHIEAIV